jgi:ketosteroid isomerase-like protein
MTRDITAVARASYDAYIKKDRAALEAILADDFHFSSPLDNRLDRASYLKICWPNSQTIEDFEIKHLVAYGDNVFISYIGKGRGGKHFRNTEIMTIRNGKLVEVEVYFGWSLPHPAAEGTHLDETAKKS